MTSKGSFPPKAFYDPVSQERQKVSRTEALRERVVGWGTVWCLGPAVLWGFSHSSLMGCKHSPLTEE